MGASYLLLCIILGEEAGERRSWGERPKGYRTTNKDWKIRTGANQWTTSMNNSVWGRKGGVCGFTVRHWPAAGSAEADVTENQNERLYLCILAEINHSEAEKLSDPPPAPVRCLLVLTLCPPPLFCMYLKRSSEAGNSPVSSTRRHTPESWLRDCCSPPPPPPPHLSPAPTRFLPV